MNLPPVVPFEPVSTERAPSGEEWIAQFKWDGVRVLTYYDGTDVRLFNRRLNERTLQYPEYQAVTDYCQARNVILDGEIIALENGKPSFHQVMKRDSLRSGKSLAGSVLKVPVVYMLFDILYCNDEWVIDKPLSERQALLEELVIPDDRVQIVQSFTQTEELFGIAQAHGLEGVVYKDLGSTYALKGKDQRWRKHKNYQDVNAVIGGVTYCSGVVNAILLGLYNEEGRLVYIGHAGTGKLSRQDWIDLTALTRPLIVPEKPFVNEPERSREAAWLQPRLTVKIRFMEWTRYLTLRQPSIQAFLSVAPEECTFLREK
ncbi:DNA ligase [Paenibacillus chitinolyticus]|uniref:ATP-dependent DNA ligase n=1 Tax=Paenibacillus chitinolyticus TaxID=79263 RepID=UPI003D0006FD